jgi:hypothetical protein
VTAGTSSGSWDFTQDNIEYSLVSFKSLDVNSATDVNYEIILDLNDTSATPNAFTAAPACWYQNFNAECNNILKNTGNYAFPSAGTYQVCPHPAASPT